MSFVSTQPEALTAAAPTTGVVPAAHRRHAQIYQAVSAQAVAIHEMFVNTLGIGARSYAATDAANAIAAG